jgi:signal transduction histidine kinase
MQAASKNIKINMTAPKVTVFADKQRVQQVCMNLLSNAIKFTYDGTIDVCAWVNG